MIRFLFLFACVAISWAVQPALESPACKKCNKTCAILHFNNNGDCRECLYKIYDELGEKFSNANQELYCGNRFYYGPSVKCNMHILGSRDFFDSTFSDCVSLEHVAPKSHFNQDTELSNDFHNLFPAIKQINTIRQDKFFAEGFGNVRFGKCKSSVDKGGFGRMYPRNEIKGIIARAYLYMMDKSSILKKRTISEMGADFEIMLKNWDASYPPNAVECKREKIIYEIQGNHNPYISNHPNCRFNK